MRYRLRPTLNSTNEKMMTRKSFVCLDAKLHTRRALVEVQCLGKVLSCRHILLVTLLVLRVVLIRNFLPEQNFLESHIVIV